MICEIRRSSSRSGSKFSHHDQLIHRVTPQGELMELSWAIMQQEDYPTLTRSEFIGAIWHNKRIDAQGF